MEKFIENEQLEYQRIGRNKDTKVDMTYINSGEYRRKFDMLTTDLTLSRVMYTTAKNILTHRAGTVFEDMYWINAENSDIVASITDSTKTAGIRYNKSFTRKFDHINTIYTIHNHPHSLPPSDADFRSALEHRYDLGIIIGHNGIIFAYQAYDRVNEDTYKMYLQNIGSEISDEFNRQIAVLNEFKRNGVIEFWEVK
jgi:archaellum component FlaG (FlaF/FlaG flagellin family)